MSKIMVSVVKCVIVWNHIFLGSDHRPGYNKGGTCDSQVLPLWNRSKFV